MSNYFKFFKKFSFIVGKNKKVFPIIILISTLNSFIDIMGISLLVPFLSILFFKDLSFGPLQSLLNSYEQNDIIFYSGIFIILAFFLKIFVATYLYYYLTNFSLYFQRNLRIDILKKFQDINFKEYTKSKMSNYFELVTNLAPLFSTEVLMPILKIITNIILLIFLGSLLIFTNPKVFLILLFFLSFITIIYFFFSKRNKYYGKRASIANENFLKSIKETISGYLEILILDKKDFLLSRSKKFSKENVEFSIKTLVLQFVSKYIIEFVLVTFFILSMFYVFYFNQEKLNETLNTMIVYVAVSLRLIPSFNVIMTSIVSINFGVFSTDRIYSHLQSENNENDKKNKIQIKKTKNYFEKKIDFEILEFKNVSFQYDEKNKIIENLNFNIKKNEIIGLSGPSGSGKTTIINLILGLIEPTSGSLNINNKFILNDLIDEWHKIISFMPQDIFVINDTISRNITLKEISENSDIKKLKLSLEKVGLDSFIKALPSGIDTEVEETGKNFSGGQKQRIALARSIYHDKEILILDEVTSSLDINNTKKILNLLLDLKKTKTIIISSHNKIILDACDKVIETIY